MDGACASGVRGLSTPGGGGRGVGKGEGVGGGVWKGWRGGEAQKGTSYFGDHLSQSAEGSGAA